GKTTTLREYAKRLIEKGHRSITYLTFNKSAVQDAEARFGDLPINAQTLHSQAFRLVCGGSGSGIRIVEDSAFGTIIETVCGDAVDQFLAGMPTDSDANVRKKKMSKQLVCFYIRKTVEKNLLQSKTKIAEYTPDAFNAIYYPATKYHDGQGDYPPPPGFPRTNYKRFYVEQVLYVWKLLIGQLSAEGVWEFRTHDSIMKQAQLDNHRIHCTALLVDESQDMNECQIAWVTAQHAFGTHVFIVGDAVQSIYSFRGAKSQLLMRVPNCRNLQLTETYRFGPEIAAVANCLLHCKQFSPQTTASNIPTWMPYRLVGRGGPGRVTAAPIVGGHWERRNENVEIKQQDPADITVKSEQVPVDPPVLREYPVTVLAFANIDILVFAIEHLWGEEKYPGGPPLKISINTSSANSGENQWRSLKSKLQRFSAIFTRVSSDLPYYPWIGQTGITWREVTETVHSFELNQYKPVIALILKYGADAEIMFARFEEEVLGRRYSASDPSVDVVLSTVHAAKGLEWDNVMLYDSSMKDLSKYKVYPTNSSSRFQPANQVVTPERNGPCHSVELDWLSYGDDYNLWYVAVTRAKRLLCVSPKFTRLVNDMLKMRDIVESQAAE
ncbi:unnamed protein product, partial [Ectocarpus fasciculatus]